MDVLKSSIGLIFLFPLSGCYYLKSAYHQMGLLADRVPVEKALQNPELTEDQKKKIRLAQEVRQFAEQKLGLETHGNYSSYVQLDRPYVTYVVSAAPKWELKHHLWSFPFVGSVPYKGYFKESDAQEEEAGLKKNGLDTYLRGVSAYSTLGWFQDPLLSSMLRYSDEDLVNTLIHETVHATLYIKSNADFNERLAVFMGNWGTELFYQSREGTASPTLARVKVENEDEKIFGEFITKEIELLKNWYKENSEKSESNRQERFQQIKDRFLSEIKPRLKGKQYEKFSEIQLNNARLLIYKTYMQDLSVFQKASEKFNRDYLQFLRAVKTLEGKSDPEKELRNMISSGSDSQP